MIGPVILYRGKNVVNRLIKTVPEKYDCFNKKKKYFNKNLVVPAKDEGRFQLSNICWICNKLLDVQDDKVRDHCRVTRNYRAFAHWNCNINLKLTKSFQ